MAWVEHGDRIFVGGEWIKPESSERIDLVSPYSETTFASVPGASRADVDRAVAAARDAFERGAWPRTSLAERAALLRRISTGIGDRREELASLVTREMGTPITASRGLHAASPKAALDTYAEIGDSFELTSLRRAASGNALVTREPVGVVAAIVPWNAPQLLTMLKLAPALLAGCTMVLKPAPETSLDAYLLAEILDEAGLPPGVVNVLPAGRDASEYLVTHPSIDKVTFTGSTTVGRHIAALCGQNLRRVTLELGGKSAGIILDDADMDLVVASIEGSSFRNGGQACSAKTRLLVSPGRKSELVERLVELVKTMTVGDPEDPATKIGPLVSEKQRDSVNEYIASAHTEGARAVIGGNRSSQPRGWFVEPTVFDGVQRGMTIAQEEIFGPVVSVMTYEDEDDAVAIANDSAYGLSGSVFTADVERGLSLARRVRTGTMELNGRPAGYLAPMGGFKASGIGREFGVEGLEGYLELKSIGVSDEVAELLV